MAITDQTVTATAASAGSSVQRRVVMGCALLGLGLSLHIWSILSLQQTVNFLMGGVLGYTLYRAAFGFTGPWRTLIVKGRSLGLRRTIVMLGAASIGIMLLNGLWGYGMTVHPVGWALLLGAFMFGIGMQLGGCCGSGTAYVAGGGSARGMVTLAFFIAGSVWGSIDAPFYWGWAQFGRFTMVESFGHAGAIAATLALLAALWAYAVWHETRVHGAVDRQPDNVPHSLRRVVFGPWSPYGGAAALGVLTALAVVVTLQPWGITFGYTVYGVKILTALGFDVGTWYGLAPTPFWSAGWAQAVIAEPMWQNTTANMTIGLMVGAALAAGLVGQWRPSLRGIPATSLLAAAIGGLMMGYGARISTGCNIGAMVNGIASGSLHGWAWMAAAFLGTMLGVKLRPMFRIAD